MAYSQQLDQNGGLGEDDVDNSVGGTTGKGNMVGVEMTA